MDGMCLRISEEKTRLPVGTSKLFGNPDVWYGFEWPHYTENREEYDLSFVCQINCTDIVNIADIAPLEEIHFLPKTGMLYFFYNMDELPPESSYSKDVRVLYYDGDTSVLHGMLRTDQDGNDMSLKEMKIHFNPPERKENVYYICLGGTSSDSLQLLLQINSFETDGLKITFADNGSLCFFADRSKLNNKDFSEILVRQMGKNEVTQ